MLLKYKEISKKILTCFYKKQCLKRRFLSSPMYRRCIFFILQNPFFFLNFYFVQKCTEMIPEKGHKKPELKLLCNLLEFKNDGCFSFPCRNELLCTT